ncbi:unnamed protein product [Allacma fusca]|uniref:Uncharacterized protein n=1 Tax=Allacma fusca TaxID=39272 RepID=A0A8J2PCS4_9HEXA|nr:unnamed protein product [Allacma fusca]
MCLPVHLILGVGFYIGLLVSTPEASYMAFSAVNPEWRNWFTFLICAFLDIVVMLFYLWPLVVSAFSTLLFFDKCTHQISNFNAIIQKRSKERTLNPLHLVYFYWKCRHLQLWIQIFNLCYADLIFLFKILNLLLGIVLISFAVLIFDKSVLHGAVLLHIGIMGGLIFNVAFERAFSIPLSLNRFKASIIMASKRFKISEIMCKRVKSIPPIAINVGVFNKLGRMSAENFVLKIFGLVHICVNTVLYWFQSFA